MMREPWPITGPGFNSWNKELSRFVAILEAAPKGWWVADPSLKYLNLRIDTRRNAFLIFAEEIPKAIDPNRVLEAIDRF